MTTHRNGVILAFAIVLATGLNCFPQEIASVDLTKVAPDGELRSPPRAPGAKRGGMSSTYGCFDHSHDTASLLTTLVLLDRPQYRFGDQPTFAATVTNVGVTPVTIPFSPHLADLQPADPGKKVSYYDLRVTLWIGGNNWDANIGGTVTLYGAKDRPGTLIVLQPREWVEIIAKGNLIYPADGLDVAQLVDAGDVNHANASVSLYHDQTLLAAEGVATVSREVCISQTQGPNVYTVVTR